MFFIWRFFVVERVIYFLFTGSTLHCKLDITLYKNESAAFLCLAASQQISYNSPTESTAAYSPTLFSSSLFLSPPFFFHCLTVFLCKWSHMTQQIHLPGAGQVWSLPRREEKNCFVERTWSFALSLAQITRLSGLTDLAKNKRKRAVKSRWMSSAVP